MDIVTSYVTLNDTKMEQLSHNSTEITQDNAYTEERFPLIIEILQLMLPITAIMLLSLINMVAVQEIQQLWNWRLQSRAKRLNASVDFSRKYILITGCDRGLGYEMAKRLDKSGFSVIAGCLNANSERVRKLRQETSPNLSTVQLDVTNHEDLDNASQWISENIEGELWGVVNNAGICFVGTPEIMAQSDISNIIGVNLQGTINVTKKFLPMIRKSQGRIVNIGSLNGDVPMPFFSLYNATKAAIKSLTESLGYELKDWGVKVSLIAPSAFKTDIIGYDKVACSNKWWAEASVETRRDYGKDYFTMPMRESRRMNVSSDYTDLTDSVLHALTSDSPKPVYRIGVGSQLLPALCKFLPPIVKNHLCGSVLNFIAIKPAAVQSKRN